MDELQALFKVGQEAYHALVTRDVENLWAIQDFIYHWPTLDLNLARITSRWPWRDVCCVVWLLFVLGVYDIGCRHFWVGLSNLFFCFVSRKLIKAKRPVEYDARLQAMTDLLEDSYGLPSLESYMSVVIVGHYALYSQMWSTWTRALVLYPLGTLTCFLVGFTRVYSRARFPHQIIASWALGVLGLTVGIDFCNWCGFHRMNGHEHNVWAAVAFGCVAVNWALAFEANESRLVYIPKKEFIKVMAGILNGSAGEADAAGDAREGEEEEEEDEDLVMQDARAPQPLPPTPRAAANRRAKQELGTRLRSYTDGKRVKHDSFYFLQKSLEARAAAAREGSGLGLLGADGDGEEHAA